MFLETQELILKKQRSGVFSGAVYQFIEGTQCETVVLGNAAVVPKQEKMTRQHLFDVASLTKVVCTTTVILKLWEQGRLTLDTPLQRYLPAFTDENVTIRQLLTHTADIEVWIPNRDQLGAEALREAYLNLKSGAKRGRSVKYTDTGTILLGFLLESIYQKPVTAVFEQEVLKPLKMNQSSFPLLTPEQLLHTVPTAQLADLSVLRGITHDPKARILGVHAGNAGLFSTIDDLAKFARVYLDFGKVEGKSFLKETTIRALLKDQTPQGDGGRSLGWDLLGDSPVLYHTGYTGTFMLLDPLAQSAFIFLSNRVHLKDERQAYIRHRDEVVDLYLRNRTTL